MRQSITQKLLPLLIAAACLSGCAGDSNGGSGGGGDGNGDGGGSGAISDAGASAGGSGGTSNRGGSSAGGGGFPGADAGMASGGSASGGAAASGGSAGSVMPPRFCNVDIRSTNGAPLSNLAAGPGETITLRGEVTTSEGFDPQPRLWSWTVTLDGRTITNITRSDSDPGVVTIPTTDPGNYVIEARVHPDCRVGRVEAAAVPRAQRERFFFVRIVPPPGTGWPPADEQVRVVAGAPTARDFALKRGVPVTIDPRRDSPILSAVPAYVRLTTPDSSFVLEGRSTQAAGYTTQIGLRPAYDILVIPDGLFAPALFRRSTEDIKRLPFVINPANDPDILIAGHLVSPLGPLSGGRVLLRGGSLSSTLGAANPQGSLQLAVRPGRFGVLALPPDPTGLPTLELPEASGLTLTNTAAGAQRLDVTWNTVPLAGLVLTVTAPDGTTAAGGATVKLDLVTPAPGLGTVVLNGGAPLAARGQVSLTGMTDVLGEVRFAGLPRVPVRVRVVPPGALDAHGAAETAQVFDLTAGDLAGARLTLKKSVPARGQLLPVELGAGATVRAFELGGIAETAPLVAAANATGQFAFSLAPGKSYRLLAEPPAARAGQLPRTPLGEIVAGETDTAIVTPRLPMGLPFSGVVRDPDGLPLRGAVLQVYCLDANPACVDFSRPQVGTAAALSEAVTDSEGRFVLALPDPGTGS